ncbi:hypothetical protein Tco_1076547, partial [Tanacetum coccineum]
TGRRLGVYNLGVATPRALVHAGDKTSRDARSWYMISGDDKSWVVIVLHIFTVILHNCEGNDQYSILEKSIIEMCEPNTGYDWERIRAGWPAATPQGGGTGGRVLREGRRVREPRMRKVKQTGEPKGQGNDQGVEVNEDVDGVPEFSTIIAQQLQNLLPTMLAQVGNQGSNQGDNMNQSGTAINDNIQGDVRNVIVNNGRRGCTYKEFLTCNPKEYDGKGGAIVYTR